MKLCPRCRDFRNKVNSKAGNKKRAICFATLQQNELNSNVAGFTTHVSFKPVLRQTRLQGLFFVVGKTRDIASQLVLQKSHKTSCTFFAARFTVPQGKTKGWSIYQMYLWQLFLVSLSAQVLLLQRPSQQHFCRLFMKNKGFLLSAVLKTHGNILFTMHALYTLWSN